VLQVTTSLGLVPPPLHPLTSKGSYTTNLLSRVHGDWGQENPVVEDLTLYLVPEKLQAS